MRQEPAHPPFQRVKTQDSRKVLEIIDAVAEGLIRMPNSSPIMTICIDSVSVIWSVQQEVAAALAEQRATKFHKEAAEANVTMQDWGKAKRPIKMVLNRFSKTDIPFLVLIAREKDLYTEQPNGDLKKTGVTINAVKDTEYDMNLVLHFMLDENKKWAYEVTKVQGGLNEIFSIGSRGSTLPLDKLFAYAEHLKPQAANTSIDEDDLAGKIASQMLEETIERTSANLARWAQDMHKLTPAQVGKILKDKGFTGFDPSKWDQMKAAIAAGAKDPTYSDAS